MLIARSIPHLRALLRDVAAASPPLAALVPDLFAAATLPLAAELAVPGYLFIPASLTALHVMRTLVELHDDASSGEYRDLPDPLLFPCGAALRHEDVPVGMEDSKAPVYAQIVEEGRRYRLAAGFLVNTFYEMEPAAVEEFKVAAERGTFPPVYPVGPFVRSGSEEDATSPCVTEWLDRQPNGSVVYVSFGSAGALSVEQTAELAAGLEDSGHRFLWVVRMPSLDGENHSDMGKRGDLSGGEEDDPLAWLPEGFLDRTSGRGLAVRSWAPQVRVLSHPATAAFVSHCGWNSTLESVSYGVPMVAWPLYAEQRMNAVFLSESVGVALQPCARVSDGVIGREEVAEVVRELMEGEKGRAVRRRTGDLRQAADMAWAPEGSSRRAMEEVAGRWRAAALGREEPPPARAAAGPEPLPPPARSTAATTAPSNLRLASGRLDPRRARGPTLPPPLRAAADASSASEHDKESGQRFRNKPGRADAAKIELHPGELDILEHGGKREIIPASTATSIASLSDARRSEEETRAVLDDIDKKMTNEQRWRRYERKWIRDEKKRYA
nr:unnamed protein product [Digitaria exilis]